jgi:hypothetical protein
MTGSAAALEDPTRWLGVVITLLGALVINPSATDHYMRGVADQGVAGARQARGYLARYIPALRRDAEVHAVTAAVSTSWGNVTGTARGIVGWSVTATTDEKLALLDLRSRRLHDEIGDLQADLRNTEKRLSREHAEAVAALRHEDSELREALETFQQESVRADASALPVIVVGVVLGGLADDASGFPMWVWSLGLVLVSGYAIRRCWVIWRDR